MTSALERVLAALDRVGCTHRHGAGQYKAQCPAHEDHNPSMTVRNGDGKVLLYCHVGCTTEQILAALGLDYPDLYDTEQDRQRLRSEIVAEYDYHNADGVVLYQKVRYFPKDFRVRHPDGRGGWNRGIGQADRVLYRLPEVLTAIREDRTIYIVEGEKDADRLTSLGHVATCNFDGASKDDQRPKWRSTYSDTLHGAHVVVIADNDAPGQAHASAIATSLAGKAKSITLVRPAVDFPGADISDHLDAGHGLDELVTIEANTATPPGGEPPHQLDCEPNDESSSSVTAGIADLYQPIDWHELWARTSAEPDWLVPGIIERGRLHAIYAPKKHKKSLLTLVIVASLVTGRPLLGRPNPHGQSVRVLYIDIENSRDDIRQRLQDAGYGPGDLSDLTYYSFPSLPGLDSAAGGTHLLALIERHQPELLVLDTTSRVVTGKENDADTFRSLYRHSLAPIKALGIAVLRLDNAGKDLSLGQRGSSAKSDDLDTAWAVSKHGEDRITLRLDFQRSNHHPPQIELVRHLDPLRFVRLDSVADRPEVTTLMAHLDRLNVPLDAGRPAARIALNGAGIKAADRLLEEVIKIRKSCAQDQRAVISASDLVEIDYDCAEADVPNTISAAQSCAAQDSRSSRSEPGSSTAGAARDFPASRSAQVSRSTPQDCTAESAQDPQICRRCKYPAKRLVPPDGLDSARSAPTQPVGHPATTTN